jgi:outer membrane protein OmpA-like peptidoglycan-associated protein
MKRTLVICLAVALTAVGCAQPMTKTQKGAAIGTGIGAVVGGLAGGGIGRYMDNQEATMRQQLAGVEGANIQRNADLLAVTFKSDVLFDTNSAALKAGSYDEISRVAQVLNQYPETTIMIAGHTDSTGSDTLNQQLSEQRAMSVKNALTGQGVNPARMSAVGYGESKPIADNNTESGRQTNRRVAITITPRQ